MPSSNGSRPKVPNHVRNSVNRPSSPFAFRKLNSPGKKDKTTADLSAFIDSMRVKHKRAIQRNDEIDQETEEQISSVRDALEDMTTNSRDDSQDGAYSLMEKLSSIFKRRKPDENKVSSQDLSKKEREYIRKVSSTLVEMRTGYIYANCSNFSGNQVVKWL